jgi:hypothetical protein
MNLPRWLTTLLAILALAGCAAMATDQRQVPVQSYPHDDGPDMRSGMM